MIPNIEPAQSPMRGIFLKIASVVLFSIMAAMMKAVADKVPAGQLVFFRSFVGLVPILVAMIVTKTLFDGLRVNSLTTHFKRGFLGTLAMASGFAALAYLSLPEATVLGYAAPILTVIFATLLLGEAIRFVRLMAVLIGMAGVVIVLWPQLNGAGGDRSLIGVALALTGAAAAALVAIQLRQMVGQERPSAIVFWFGVTGTLLSLLTIPFGWVMPTPWEATLLIAAGLLGGTAQILMTAAYRYADASVVAPFEYVSILSALALGYVFFSEIPTIWTLVGSVVIVSAGVLIIFREHQLGHKRRIKARGLVH